MKKDSGFVEKMLPVLLSIGLVFGLVLLSGQFMKVLQIREEISQIARAYILEMETKGCLTVRDRNRLKETLEKTTGLSDIDFVGSTITPAAYGEEIHLFIHGNIQRNLQITIPFFYEENRLWSIPIEVKLFSTAKH